MKGPRKLTLAERVGHQVRLEVAKRNMIRAALNVEPTMVIALLTSNEAEAKREAAWWQRRGYGAQVSGLAALYQVKRTLLPCRGGR